MLYAGIDLGGTKIAAGLVSEDGKIIKNGNVATGVGRPYQEIVKDMAGLIKNLVDESGYKMDDIASVGIGTPGSIDAEKGEVVFANNLYWHHVPVCGELRRYINKPVYIDNDANVAGLAEYVAGACRGASNSMVITLGTGVGSGIIINGKVFRGSHGIGAELGHIIVQANGILCTCGNRGCLERYASATALIRDGKEAAEKNKDSLIYKKVNGKLDDLTAKIVIDCAKEGDKDAVEIFNRFVSYLTVGIITVINSFDPEVIAIGGGVSRAGDFLLDPLRKQVDEHIFYKDFESAKIVLAELGNEAGIIGAAMLGKE